MSKILLVDDEPDILEFVSYNLRKEGYEVFTADNGGDAIKMAEQHRPQLIILDIMMPGLDGMETCKIIRSKPEFRDTLIAFLTARNEDYSQISGFEYGADDYISKPIKPGVFISRIKALLRRGGTEKYLRSGDIEIDLEKHTVYKGNKKLDLPKKEFSLIELLMSKPGKVYTREEILEKIWGSEIIVGDRTIDVHIRKLREKLGENVIKTIKGIGYKFDL